MAKITFEVRAGEQTEGTRERSQEFVCKGIVEAGCPYDNAKRRGRLSDGTWSSFCEDCVRDFKETIRKARVRIAIQKGELPF